jgi:hypothetical protein
MSTDRMSVSVDRMSAVRMSADRVSAVRMFADRMFAVRMSADRMSADRMSADRMSTDEPPAVGWFHLHWMFSTCNRMSPACNEMRSSLQWGVTFSLMV